MTFEDCWAEFWKDKTPEQDIGMNMESHKEIAKEIYRIRMQKVIEAIDKIINHPHFSKGFYDGDLEDSVIKMKKELGLD